MSTHNTPNVEVPGPVVATVVGHDTQQGLGTLRVTLEGYRGTSFGSETGNIPAYYCPPFFGQTNVAYNGQNTGNDQAFRDTQKSYGMSFVPPDVGTRVLCISTVNPQKLFWIGVVPDDFANHMVPGIAASGNVDLSPEQQSLYGNTSVLPVAEVNRSLEEYRDDPSRLDNAPRPLHPIAGFLLDSGLIGDPFRGAHTSTMRRAGISNVYGISTPGPLDRRPGQQTARQGTRENPSAPRPTSRLGGTQIVMDDGDDRFQRKTTQDAGGPEYADRTSGEEGDPRIPYGESFRIRTRTGHQILLHNSEDLIYIGNSRGTAWIELSSDGKIDIFAQDSISVHSQQDFNFHASRDVNIEAGRNVNIKASGTNSESPTGAEGTGDTVGRIQIESSGNLTTIVGDSKITKVTNDVSTTIEGAERKAVTGDSTIAVTADFKLTATNVNTTASSNTRITSTSGSNNLTAGTFHRETANKIEMNCDPAETADSDTGDVVVAEPLSTHQNRVTDITLPWAGTEYQSETPLESIMKRIPQHEPWYNHENIDPLGFAPPKTDREITGE